MRPTKTISFLFTPLFLVSAAVAQAGDWQTVRNLQPGTKISVQDGGPFRGRCIFEHASDDQLVCQHLVHGPRGTLIPSGRVYERNRIREVRLEHGDTANMATGAVIGGGIGAAIGASAGNGAYTRGGGALLLGTGGAIIGGIFGRDFPVTHGKVVYRR